MLDAALLVLLIALQAADLFTTIKALKRPDASEANPLFGDKPRLATMLLAKAALIGIGVAATVYGAWFVTGALDLIGIAVIYNNVLALQGRDTIF